MNERVRGKIRAHLDFYLGSRSGFLGQLEVHFELSFGEISRQSDHAKSPVRLPIRRSGIQWTDHGGRYESAARQAARKRNLYLGSLLLHANAFGPDDPIRLQGQEQVSLKRSVHRHLGGFSRLVGCSIQAQVDPVRRAGELNGGIVRGYFEVDPGQGSAQQITGHQAP